MPAVARAALLSRLVSPGNALDGNTQGLLRYAKPPFFRRLHDPVHTTAYRRDSEREWINCPSTKYSSRANRSPPMS